MLTILKFAHKLVEQCVGLGETVVDATAGNGSDTLFLANLVGNQGIVHAFDIQQQAIDATKRRLAQEEGNYSHVRLHGCSHAELELHVPEAAVRQIGAVMFNLGYLPGGDHQAVTTPSATLPALQAAAASLRIAGILTIVLYSGHPGGEAEAAAVRSWAEQLPQEQFQVLEYRFMNQRNHPPCLIAVEKLKPD